MQIKESPLHHPWDVSYREARRIQEDLREKVSLKRLVRPVRHVAGADVSSSRKSPVIWAGISIMTYPDLRTEEEEFVRWSTDFPYVPGLLSFREVPALLEVLKKIRIRPDILLCDGQGIAHPRKLGLASHLGLLTGLPTVGCAKSRLIGNYQHVGRAQGQGSSLTHKGEVLGTVLRTREGIKPVFVSPGHGVTLEEAVEVVLGCGAGYRIPEPIRRAHLLVNRLRRHQETS